MANEVKLEVYTVRIRRSRDTDNYLPLDNFVGQTDFLQFFQNYISSFDHQLEINDVQKRSLKLDSARLAVSTQSRMISGIIESGDYGYESVIYNIATGNEQYRREIDDTEIKPFYFLLYLPRNENKGFVILQRLGIYGIHSIFRNHLTSFFQRSHPDMQLEFNPFVSSQLARAFLDRGNIKEFVLTRYNLPADVVERLGMLGHEEDIMSIELTIKARKNRWLPLNHRVSRFLNHPNTRIFDIHEFEELGFDGEHRTKMVVNLGRNKRTIDLSETGNIRPYYDIDNEVQKDASGHPTFESIDSIAKSLINDLQTELNPDA